MIMKGKNLLKIVGLFVVTLVVLQSCKDELSPGYEYMPDMYRSPAVETYSETELTETGLSALQPADNSIPRGHEPYPYPNSNEGYEAAGQFLKNPVPFSEEALAEGKTAYGKFCVHCHGKKGEGDGSVPTNSDYPPPPAYNKQLKDLPEGKMFHTLMYGRNLMGSHASQISSEDRWKIIYYVQSLQDGDRFDATYRGVVQEEIAEESSESMDGAEANIEEQEEN